MKINMLTTLHSLIDKKFNRKDRSKMISPILLKSQMTLWSIASELIDYKPQEISMELKKLVNDGSVLTNLDNEKTFVFDAYFIPKTELLDEEEFKIYMKVKSKIM